MIKARELMAFINFVLLYLYLQRCAYARHNMLHSYFEILHSSHIVENEISAKANNNLDL